MADTEPEHRGPVLDALGDALRDVGKLNILVAYSPGISNREDHLDAIQDGFAGLAAIIPDVDLLDPPEEGS